MTGVGRRACEWLPVPSSPQLPIIFPGNLWVETWPVPYPITTEAQPSEQEQCHPGMASSVWLRHRAAASQHMPPLAQTASFTGSPTGWETWHASLNAPKAWSPAPHSAGPFKGTDSHSRSSRPLSSQALCGLPQPRVSWKGPRSPESAFVTPRLGVLNLTHSLTHSAQDATCSGSLRSAHAAQTFPCINPVEREAAKGSVPFGRGPRRGHSQMLFLSLPPYYSTSPGLCIYPEGLPRSTSCSNKYLRLPRIYH